MKQISQACLVSTVLLGLTPSHVSSPFALAAPAAMAQEEARIDITIRDSTFVLDRPVASQPGIPTAIIIRNQDIIRHGFTSSIFQGQMVRAEGEGIAAYGRSMEGFYVAPGKTLVLRLTIEQTGRHSFRCDLHPGMKGEVLVIDLGTA